MEIYYHVNSDVLIWTFTDIDVLSFTDDLFDVNTNMLSESTVYSLADEQGLVVGIQFDFASHERGTNDPNLLHHVNDWATAQDTYMCKVKSDQSGFVFFRTPPATRERLTQIVILYDEHNAMVGFEQHNVQFAHTRWKYAQFPVIHINHHEELDGTIETHYDEHIQSLHIHFVGESNLATDDVKFVECTGQLLIHSDGQVVGIYVNMPEYITQDILISLTARNPIFRVDAENSSLHFTIQPFFETVDTDHIMLQISRNWEIHACTVFDELDTPHRYRRMIDHFQAPRVGGDHGMLDDTVLSTTPSPMRPSYAEVSTEYTERPFIP